MKDLIPVTQNGNGELLVSARNLYKGLEITDRFSRWFERMCEYGFTENEDYTSVKSSTVVNNGAVKELQDYALKIDMAKEISMIQRNEKGKQIRKYIIECEKQLQELLDQEKTTRSDPKAKFDLNNAISIYKDVSSKGYNIPLLKDVNNIISEKKEEIIIADIKKVAKGKEKEFKTTAQKYIDDINENKWMIF